MKRLPKGRLIQKIFQSCLSIVHFMQKALTEILNLLGNPVRLGWGFILRISTVIK